MLKVLLISVLTPCSLWAAPQDMMETPARPVSSGQISQVQEYTRSLSKEWLKELFHVDLDKLGLTLQSKARPYSQVKLGEAPAPDSPLGAAGYVVKLQFEQYDDIRRLAADLRDIPFALKMETDGALGPRRLHIKTTLYLPLSWKDELRAGASIPLPRLGRPFSSSSLDTSRMLSGWKLTSAYTNRLGVSSLETGLETRLQKTWNLDLDYRVRFGQGIDEYSQWLRIGTVF
ncbi:MAG: hypothetical protein V4498_02055 [candidate division FCPU426 bacterium]